MNSNINKLNERELVEVDYPVKGQLQKWVYNPGEDVSDIFELFGKDRPLVKDVKHCKMLIDGFEYTDGYLIQLINGLCWAPDYVSEKIIISKDSIDCNTLNSADIRHKPLFVPSDEEHEENAGMFLKALGLNSEKELQHRFLKTRVFGMFFDCVRSSYIEPDSVISRLTNALSNGEPSYHLNDAYEYLKEIGYYDSGTTQYMDKFLCEYRLHEKNERWLKESQFLISSAIERCEKYGRFYENNNSVEYLQKRIAYYEYWGWFSEDEIKLLDELREKYGYIPGRAESKGERIVNELLHNNGYAPIRQYRFKDCKDVNTLPFDTMINVNGRMCLIEFDGEQHFRPVDLFGGADALKVTQRHDNIKNSYCEEHGIPLLRIRFDQIDKIEELVTDLIINPDKYTITHNSPSVIADADVSEEMEL